MAGNILKAIITADGGQFTKTLGELQGQLKRFESALKNTSNVESFNRLTRAIDVTKQRIAALSTAGNPLRAIQGGASQATAAMTNLGRVVQDAPFGFIGIANNLNPLLESFDRLKQSTGSTGGAIKALGASLVGAGGLGFAVSVVSSLLIVFGDKLFGAAAASHASEEALKRYEEQLSRAKNSISDLSDALQFFNTLGAINVKINNLGDIQDLREQSVAQRQLTFDLTTQRDQLKVIGQQIVSDTQLNAKDREKAINDNQQAIEEINKKIIESERTQSILYRKIALQKITDQKDTNKKQEEEFDRFFNKTLSRAKELDDFFAKTAFPVHFDFDPNAPKGDILKSAQQFIDRALAAPAIGLRVQLPVSLGLKVIDKKFLSDTKELAPKTFEESRKEFVKSFESEAERKLIDLNLRINPKINQDFQDRLKAQVDQIRNIISEGLKGLFAGVGESLADSLSGGNGAKAMINAIGDLISSLGKALISYGVVKSGLDKILAGGIAIPGGVAIALGVAAVAAGKLIKNSFGGFRAAGGPVQAGKSFIVGEKGPELFVPNTGGNIVSNRDLFSSGRGLSAGQAQVQVAGTFRIEGKDLIAAIALNNASQRRLG